MKSSESLQKTGDTVVRDGALQAAPPLTLQGRLPSGAGSQHGWPPAQRVTLQSWFKAFQTKRQGWFKQVAVCHPLLSPVAAAVPETPLRKEVSDQ